LLLVVVGKASLDMCCFGFFVKKNVGVANEKIFTSKIVQEPWINLVKIVQL